MIDRLTPEYTPQPAMTKLLIVFKTSRHKFMHAIGNICKLLLLWFRDVDVVVVVVVIIAATTAFDTIGVCADVGVDVDVQGCNVRITSLPQIEMKKGFAKPVG